MTSDSSTNVKDYLQHQMLTPVPGTIIYRTLVHIKKEVRANVKSAPSSLGGNSQGHLGLVTSAATYARINSNAVFTRPTHPVPLVQLPSVTQFRTIEAVRLHRETIGTFNL